MRLRLVFAVAAGLLLAAPLAAEGRVDDCPVLLTVTGAISDANRGPFNPVRDKFFSYAEIEFDKAHSIDCAQLAKLPRKAIRADFPKGRQIHTYEGPLLKDVLDLAGASGKSVILHALDGYMVEASLDDLLAKGAVVATGRDGVRFGIGDFGPVQIVFPRADRDDLKDLTDDLWVWSIFHIRVE